MTKMSQTQILVKVKVMKIMTDRLENVAYMVSDAVDAEVKAKNLLKMTMMNNND